MLTKKKSGSKRFDLISILGTYIKYYQEWSGFLGCAKKILRQFNNIQQSGDSCERNFKLFIADFENEK